MEILKHGSLSLELNKSECFYRIVGCDKDASHVTIPAQVNGIYIEEILDSAFEECASLKSVTFDKPSLEQIAKGEVLSAIGDYAFAYCTSLEKIEVPDSVTYIGRGAFYSCTSLESVTFGSYTNVCDFAFYGCANLKSCSNVEGYVGEGTFYQCQSLTDLPINNKTTEICEEAFGHCYGLEAVTIPKSVKRIESLAFRGCHGLKSVTFENTSIWYSRNRYFDKEVEIDVSSPKANAQALARMDFDDGIIEWYVKNS